MAAIITEYPKFSGWIICLKASIPVTHHNLPNHRFCFHLNWEFPHRLKANSIKCLANAIDFLQWWRCMQEQGITLWRDNSSLIRHYLEGGDQGNREGKIRRNHYIGIALRRLGYCCQYGMNTICVLKDEVNTGVRKWWVIMTDGFGFVCMSIIICLIEQTHKWWQTKYCKFISTALSFMLDLWGHG